MASLFDVLSGVIGSARSAQKKPTFTPEMDQQIMNPRFDWTSRYAQLPHGVVADSKAECTT